MTPRSPEPAPKQRILHVNIRFKQVVVRVAAATGLLAGYSVVACSSSTETPINPGPSNTGNTGNTNTGNTNTGGTSAAAGAGTGGASGGSAGAGAGMCPGNQIMLMGACMCPPYASTYCEAKTKCVSAMKDPDNCGGCDKACGATNACAAGACTPDLVAFGEFASCGTLELVSVPGKALYVLSTMTGKLQTVPLPAGGAPVDVATVPDGTAFALDDKAAYVAAGMKVVRVDLATKMTTTLVSETSKVFDVAVADGKIYYAVGTDVKQADATTAGMGTSVAKSIDDGLAQGVAVAGGMVLYASNQAFNLEADPIMGDMHAKIGASQSGLLFGHRSVQTDGTYVYWANGALQRAKFAGDDHAATTAAQPIDGKAIIAYAIDGTAKMAYIATEDGSFEKSSFDAAQDEATWVSRKLDKVSSIALDDTSVYLASGCKILKSAR